jgi:hypothetical protein
MSDPLKLIELAEEKARATDYYKESEQPLRTTIKHAYVTMELAFRLSDALSEIETLKNKI